MKEINFLHGAYDLHIHCSPDSVDRVVSGLQAATQAQDKGMAGIGIKDHCTDTRSAAAAIEEALGYTLRVVSWLVLNPPVGGINALAVEAALQKGTDIICFPTYSTAHSRNCSKSTVTGSYPLPPGFPGYHILDDQGQITRETFEVLECIAAKDGVLATGHLSAQESLALTVAASSLGIQRILINHASSSSIDMPLEIQQRIATLGGYIEHSALALQGSGFAKDAVAGLVQSIRQLGWQRVILSTDYGRSGIGTPTEGFEAFLEALYHHGVEEKEIKTMSATNIETLLKH